MKNHVFSLPEPTYSSDRQNQTSDGGKFSCVCVEHLHRDCIVGCFLQPANSTDVCEICCCWLWTGCWLYDLHLLQPCTTSEDCQWAPVTTWCSCPVIYHSSQHQWTSLSSTGSHSLLRLATLESPGALEASSPASHSFLPPVNWLAVSHFCYLWILTSSFHVGFSAFPIWLCMVVAKSSPLLGFRLLHFKSDFCCCCKGLCFLHFCPFTK